MDAAQVHDTLTEITRLQGEAEAARRAPPSHDERLAIARAQLERAAAQFRGQPFRIPGSGPSATAAMVMGAFMFLTPMAAVEAVEKAIKAGPAGLDRETRAIRISVAETKISGLVGALSYDDLRQMRREKDEAHTHLRALGQRRAEVQAAIDRRQMAMDSYRQDRAALARPPRRVSYEGDPPSLGRAERDIAGAAADGWLREAARELAADQATLMEIQTRYQVVAGDWRRTCSWVEQLEKLLPVLPAPQERDNAA